MTDALKTCASVFAGGGGWEVGARAAGLRSVWAVELDPQIAEVHEMNFPESRVIVAPAEEVDPYTLEKVDVLFASPPCQAHSNARSKKLAPREDADVGLCLIRYIEALMPRRFFMENVEGYKRSRTYKAIINALHTLGYWTDSQVINAADYGVPQTRRRLIVRASLDGFPAPLPNRVPWVGWYQAIEDLIPTLPESKFADWQLKRLGAAYDKEGKEGTLLIGGANRSASFLEFAVENRDSIPGVKSPDQPVSLVASTSSGDFRAFIASQTNGSGRETHPREEGEPCHTVTGAAAKNLPRAFIAGVQGEGGDLRRETDEPAPTVTTAHDAAKYRAFLQMTGNTQKAMPTGTGVLKVDDPANTVCSNSSSARAFLVESKNSNQQWGDGARLAHEPATTVVTDHKPSHQPRAFVVEGSVGGPRPPTVRDAADPLFTYTSNNGTQRHNATRAQIEGRVVAMTPRALARFQSFPDSYALPVKAGLACKVIGNAVCPLLAQRLIEAEAAVSSLN